jgi:hypothetical protein
MPVALGAPRHPMPQPGRKRKNIEEIGKEKKAFLKRISIWKRICVFPVATKTTRKFSI